MSLLVGPCQSLSSQGSTVKYETLAVLYLYHALARDFEKWPRHTLWQQHASSGYRTSSFADPGRRRMLRPLAVFNTSCGWTRRSRSSPDSFDLLVRQFSRLLFADLQLIDLDSSLAHALCLFRCHCDSPFLCKLVLAWELDHCLSFNATRRSRNLETGKPRF